MEDALLHRIAVVIQNGMEVLQGEDVVRGSSIIACAKLLKHRRCGLNAHATYTLSECMDILRLPTPSFKLALARRLFG